MNAKYFLGALMAAPLLPLMYVQGKRIRASVPQLPEAEAPSGLCRIASDKKPFRVLLLGESTIAGVGVKRHEEGFAGSLAEQLAEGLQRPVQWRVYARSGYTAERLRLKIVPKIEETEVDLLVIGLGGNDAFTLNRPSRWARAVKNLIADLRERYPQTPIVFCNMPPIKAFPAFTLLIKLTVGNLVELLGQTLQKTVKNLPNVFYFGEIITLKDWAERYELPQEPQAFFSDGVHPSQLTYQTWAKDIAQRILAAELL